MTASTRRELRSAATSTSTTAIDLIRALTDARPIKPTSTRCLSARRPNPGRGSTYRRGNSVQTTAATSMYRFVVGIALRQYMPLRTCVEKPKDCFKNATCRDRLAFGTTIGNAFLRKMIPDPFPLLVRESNHPIFIADRLRPAILSALPDQMSFSVARSWRAFVLAKEDRRGANKNGITIFVFSITAKDFSHGVLLDGKGAIVFASLA